MNDSGYGALFYRYTAILNLIPTYPNSISTTDILRHLAALGISVTPRSIQRDLGERLSVYFPIICNEESRPFLWSLDRGYEFIIPASRMNHQSHICPFCSSGTK